MRTNEKQPPPGWALTAPSSGSKGFGRTGGESVESLKRSLSRLLPPSPAEVDGPDQPEFASYLSLSTAPLDHHAGSVGTSEALAHPHYRLIGTIDEKTVSPT